MNTKGKKRKLETEDYKENIYCSLLYNKFRLHIDLLFNHISPLVLEKTQELTYELFKDVPNPFRSSYDSKLILEDWKKIKKKKGKQCIDKANDDNEEELNKNQSNSPICSYENYKEVFQHTLLNSVQDTLTEDQYVFYYTGKLEKKKEIN